MSFEESPPPTDADILVAIAEEAAEFCRWENRAYATVQTTKGLRTLQLRGPAFATWLRLRFRELQGRIAPAAAVKAAITALEDSTSLSAERPVFLRSAHQGQNIYIDLGDEGGAAVEIMPGSWRIVPTPPVRFVRGGLAKALPVPVSRGSLHHLRQLLNLREDGSFQLLVAWCVAALTRPDLADRAIILNLPAIPEEKRLDPAELEARFQELRPKIFGAVLDLMAMALARLPELRTKRLPRMAGFARLGIAIEEAFGEPGCFMQAYDANRAMSSVILAESDPVVAAIVKLMAGAGQWTGTATDLAKSLEPRMVPPKRLDPAALAGRLRRLAPVLRANALNTEFDREGKDRTRTIAITRREA